MLVIFVLISLPVIPVLCQFLGLQVISLGDCVRSGFTDSFRILVDPYRYLEYPEFLYLVLFLTVLTVISFLWSTVFSYTARQKHKLRSVICITNVSKCSPPWYWHEKKPLFKGFSRLDGGAYGTRTRDLLRDREAR